MNILNQKNIRYFISLGFLLFVLSLIFIFVPLRVEATHGAPDPGLYPGVYNTLSGEQVCGNLPGNRGTGTGTGTQGFPGGLYVPVKDFEAEEYLRRIAGDINAIERDTNLIERDTQLISFYLKQLCYKEFSLDHTIQQEWMRVMGLFVERITDWVLSAYAGNPIYVENPHVYYRNVDLGVTEAMRTDLEEAVAEGRIDEETAIILRRTLLNSETELIFPDYVQYSADELEQFKQTNEFAWDNWIAVSMDPNNNLYDLSSLVEYDIKQRRAAAREVERDKLLWGRGFFGMEQCGQKVFSEDPVDIRTCRTLTPGSTIQDLTSLVLGTAVRQIENADEYEEYISGIAFLQFNDVFSTAGLLYGLGTNNPGNAASPRDIEISIGDVKEQENFAAGIVTFGDLFPKEKIGIYFGENALNIVPQ